MTDTIFIKPVGEFSIDFQSDLFSTRHNSADSVPTSNLICITEVAIRTTLCIAGII